MIIRNAIRCNICGDEIESKHRHDFVTCKCGACSVDGGHDYLRRCFKEEGCYLRWKAQMQTSLATQVKSCMLVTFHAKGSLFAPFC